MAGGGQVGQAGAQAGNISQLSQLLQQMGAGKGSLPMAAGLSMMAPQTPTPQAPMARPTPATPAMPMAGAQPPQMANGGMGMGQGINPQMMNMMLAQRNGLMG